MKLIPLEMTTDGNLLWHRGAPWERLHTLAYCRLLCCPFMGYTRRDANTCGAEAVSTLNVQPRT